VLQDSVQAYLEWKKLRGKNRFWFSLQLKLYLKNSQFILQNLERFLS